MQLQSVRVMSVRMERSALSAFSLGPTWEPTASPPSSADTCLALNALLSGWMGLARREDALNVT